MLEFEVIKWLTYGLLAICFWFFIKKQNEVPFIYWFFFYSSGLRRYELIAIERKTTYVVVAYWDMFIMNDEIALQALNYFFLGTALFTVLFIYFYSTKPLKVQNLDNDDIFEKFTINNLTLIFSVFFVTSLLNTLKYILYKISFSYGYFLPLGVSGGLIVIFSAFSTLNPKKYGSLRFVMLVLMGYMAVVSYNPIVRFSFISWVACVGVILTGRLKLTQKFIVYFVGGLLVMMFFGIAGYSRRNKLEEKTFTEIITQSWERNQSTEDANMLDGFMMVLQVYPNLSDYAYGVNHLEIIVRPIPRSWWPNKPSGGWANKLGLNDNLVERHITVGISESIFGTFYAEGGLTGIIIGSLLYALFYRYLFRVSYNFTSKMRFLIKGLIIASTVPLLRGGDVAGISVFIILSFWPVFIIIRAYNSYVITENRRQRRFAARRDERQRLEELVRNARELAMS